MYRQLPSTRSTVGGVGMPTGDGVTNSPTSPLISATTPSKGARRIVRSSSAFATSMRAWLTFSWSRAASQTAAWASASPTARSVSPSETRFSVRSLRIRVAFFAATTELTQASRVRLRAATASRSAWDTWARWSWFQSSSRMSPFFTLLPSLKGNRAIWPPIGGASRARLQASTVPARVFATVASTSPAFTSATVTATGFGRDQEPGRHADQGEDAQHAENAYAASAHDPVTPQGQKPAQYKGRRATVYSYSRDSPRSAGAETRPRQPAARVRHSRPRRRLPAGRSLCPGGDGSRSRRRRRARRPRRPRS